MFSYTLCRPLFNIRYFRVSVFYIELSRNLQYTKFKNYIIIFECRILELFVYLSVTSYCSVNTSKVSILLSLGLSIFLKDYTLLTQVLHALDIVNVYVVLKVPLYVLYVLITSKYMLYYNWDHVILTD